MSKFLESVEQESSDSDFEEETFDNSNEAIVKLPTGECLHTPILPPSASSIHEIFPMSVGEFYRRYLSSESTFWEDACKVSECTDFSITPWKTEECHNSRKLKFKIPVKHFLAKESAIIQMQYLKKKNESTIIFHTSSISIGVLYSDSFTVDSHWIISSDQTQNKNRVCWVNIQWQVTWKRNVWVKSVIERNALEGAQDFFEKTIKLAKDLLRKESFDPSAPTEGEAAVVKIEPGVLSDPEEIYDVPTGEPNIQLIKDLASQDIPKLSKKVRRRKRAPSSMEVNEPISATPVKKETIPFVYAVLILILVGSAAYFPFYILNSQIPDYYKTEELQINLSKSLDDRFAMVQSLLGQLSKNVTKVPGRSIKDQWDRHWVSFVEDDQPNIFHSESQWGFFSSLFSLITSFLWVAHRLLFVLLIFSFIGLAGYITFAT